MLRDLPYTYQAPEDLDVLLPPFMFDAGGAMAAGRQKLFRVLEVLGPLGEAGLVSALKGPEEAMHYTHGLFDVLLAFAAVGMEDHGFLHLPSSVALRQVEHYMHPHIPLGLTHSTVPSIPGG